MMRKLNRILLVDDDDTTNFLHQYLFNNMKLVEHVDVALNGKEALDFIEDYDLESLPDLILLDINMPYMDGFEFLDKYQQLDNERKVGITLMMLSTSVNPKDIEKSQHYPQQINFIDKPLTKEKITTIWVQYFKD
jgi:CheY-like chemotaxis protein